MQSHSIPTFRSPLLRVKIAFAAIFLFGLAGMASLSAEEEKDRVFGDASFIAYEGPQKWPKGENAQVIKDYVVPIYFGLPTKKYQILGRIYDRRKEGIEIIGRGFAEAFFSDKDRQRDCADQARYRGGDAVVVTGDDKIIKAFGLTSEDLEKTTPLFEHKDQITVVIKFK